MSEKRKDNKGRILKTGESQRKNMTYEYRYVDLKGKRKCVYAPTLKELREKEKEVAKMLLKGGDYVSGNMTVTELMEQYMSLKTGVRAGTKVTYRTNLKIIEDDAFGRKKIRDVRMLDAKHWFQKLQDADGRGYSSLTGLKGNLKSAFQLAVNEDILTKNPFDFTLVGLIRNDKKKRPALSDEQVEVWLDYIKNSRTYKKYYDDMVILLNTGMRVSEYCGLTTKDVDFKNRVITIDHQIYKERKGDYKIDVPKTEAGIRKIPMNDQAYNSLKNVIKKAKERKDRVDVIIDGYTGFFVLNRDGYPRAGYTFSNNINRAKHEYDRLHPEYPLPMISAHVFRHTFCTKLVMSGMDLKSIQYIMGHSEIGVTMDIYTHISFDHVNNEMARIYKFPKSNDSSAI